MNWTVIGKKSAVWLSLSLALTLLTVFSAFLPINGMVGHDYAHYYPRIILGASHFWKNGLAVPHFTPSLCGGVPFFADPQSYYYSLPQVLSFFISPWFATYFSYFVFYLLGYWGMRNLSGLLTNSAEVSHFIALVFLLNGFSFAHLFVGHANHYQFLVLPGALYLLLRSQAMFSRAWRQSTLLFSLMVIYCVYSGALHILVVLGATLLVLSPVFLSRKAKADELKSIGGMGLAILICLLGTCSGKWLAAQRYSEHFYIRGIDRSQLNPIFSFIQYLWFDPLHVRLSEVFGEWSFGLWEYVGFISKFTLAAFIVYSIWLLPKTFLSRWRMTAGLVLSSVALILLATGNLLNESLPFFKHYHNPMKLMGGFIIPLCLLLGVVTEAVIRSDWYRAQSPWWKQTVSIMGLGILLCEFLVNVSPFQKHPGALGYRYVDDHYRAFKAEGGIAAVRAVDFRGGAPESAFSNGSSVMSCYEPLFGYRLEGLRATLVPGSVFQQPVSQQKDAPFNLTHPGCLLYGKELGCSAWDRIPKKENQALLEFINGKTPSDWIPFWQKALNILNALCFVLLLMALLVERVLFILKRPLLRHATA